MFVVHPRSKPVRWLKDGYSYALADAKKLPEGWMAKKSAGVWKVKDSEGNIYYGLTAAREAASRNGE